MTTSENDQLARNIFTDIMTALGAAFAIFWHWRYGEVAVFLALLIAGELAWAWIHVKMRERRERLTLPPRAGVN